MSDQTKHYVVSAEAVYDVQEIIHAWDGERTHDEVYYAVERVIDGLRALTETAVEVRAVWRRTTGTEGCWIPVDPALARWAVDEQRAANPGSWSGSYDQGS